MEDFPIYSVVGVSAGALFAGHLGMTMLPASIAGLPTPLLLLAGMAVAVSAAIRWL